MSSETMALLALMLLSSATLLAQDDSSPSDIVEKPCYLVPDGIEYDAGIPAPKDFLGFEVGELHIRHHQLVAYLTEVARHSDRIQIETIGKSHGSRPLVMLTITSPANHERIDDIQKAHRALAKPGTDAWIDDEEVPAVINMGYSVHGDESSGANAVPAVVYYLAAAKGAEIDRLLDEVVILLDPCLNPDGFDRFAAWANANRGRVINADPNHVEHTQPWPGGRVNYYWFDLNRDWMPGQHPESQARLRKFHEWKPNVVLDFHEMGTGSTYFFQPGVPKRTHPLTPNRNVELTKRMGDYHAAALDEIGSLYFTEEQFDDFYMGKGSTYPDLHGSIGILFEQASSRGHAQESNNGLVTFPFTIRNQFTCSLSSLQATLDLRNELNDHLRTFYEDSLESGRKSEAFAYAFRAPGDQSRLQSFADLLRRHDIKCYWLSEDIEHEGEVLPAATTLVIPTAQPEYRFLLSMIERRTVFEENIFYDVSAWTIPLAFNLDSFAIREPLVDELLDPVSDAQASVRLVSTDEEIVAYAIPWTSYDAPRTLYRLLDSGVKVRASQKPFTASYRGDEKEFGYGTLIVAVGIQDMSREEVADAIVDAEPAELHPIGSGLTPSGSDLGSNLFTTLKKPEVMMLAGEGVSRYEAGTIWHLLDTRLEMPLTLLRVDRLRSADLDRYNVIVLAGGRYSGIGDDEVESLQRWVSDGGTLIAMTSSIPWAQSVGLASVEFIDTEDSEDEESDTSDETKDVDAAQDELQKPYVSARDERALSLISGAIFRARVDTTHPIGYGYLESKIPVFRNNRIFMKPSSNPYANPVIYDEETLLGGYVSDENLEVLKDVASVVVSSRGSGRVILISDDPNFRAFWYGTNRLFFNAIFFGQMVRVP